jgi:hypothetical protein
LEREPPLQRAVAILTTPLKPRRHHGEELMSKRNIGIIVIALLVVVLVLLYGPMAVNPNADRMPDDVTGPGEEGMIATGAVETPEAPPEASPSPGEATVDTASPPN